MAPAGATAAPPVIGGFHQIDIDAVNPSGLNPRTHWNADEDRELQISIAQDGVLEPILVRPDPKRDQHFQVVAGERRYRAAKAVGLGEIPAIVKEVSDEKLLELALTENIQRRSMHPLDEANGFIKRLDMGGCSPDALANSVGLSKRYVTDRIRLTKLAPDAAKMLESGAMTVSHAIVLARLDHNTQKAAIQRCAVRQLNFESPDNKRDAIVMGTLGELREFVNDRARLDLASADTPEEFPELAAEVEAAKAAGATIVTLSDNYEPYNYKAAAGDPLFRGDWQECKKSDKAARAGVVVEGRRRGQKLYWKPIVKPAPAAASRASGPAAPKKSEAEKVADKKRRQADERRREETRQWDALKRKAVDAVKAHIGKAPIGAVVAGLAKSQRLAGATSAEALVRLLAVDDATRTNYSIDALHGDAQPFGFNVKQWFKEQLAAAKKATPAKAAKKAKKR